MNDYIWVVDPVTGQPDRVSYDELESDIYPQLLRPIGGFCYAANDLMRLPLPPIPYYLQNWLPKQGKCMFYAPAKSGKSYMMHQLARCIAQGEPFLGIPTTKGTVLDTQFELSESMVRNRLCSTKQNYSGVFIGTTFSMKLDTKAGQDQLEEALVAIHPDVLILDPFFKVIKGEENDSHDVLVITDYLDKLIEDYKCSLVLVHHTGKDLTKGSRGSSILEDWVDSAIEVRRLSKLDEPLKIRVTPKLLRHAELPPKPIVADLVNFEFESGELTKTAKECILAEFRRLGGRLTVKHLLTLNLGSRKTVNNALESLVNMGTITKVARGEYKYASAETTLDDGEEDGEPLQLDD